MDKNIINAIRDNDHRTLSRTITQIIDNENLDNRFYQDIYPFTQNAVRIGITGPPGAGKSTLINQLIKLVLDDGKSVGVIAVDPTSPFTGGALLGDRVRMNKFTWNDNVFIRSMGSRGDLGGLAKRAQDVGDILAASGKDIVIFETVGVGQGEYDIIKAVDIAVVVLVPESGDEVQLMKAGLIEIADFFVINKSDRPGAIRLATILKSLLKNDYGKNRLEPPVLNTIGSKGTGIAELYEGLFNHLKLMDDSGILTKKQLDRHRDRVFSLIQNKLLKEFWTSKRLVELEQRTKDVESIKSSAYEIANQIMDATKNDKI
ncbi:MAG: methylmalonyl Co-A mutase-associated GTPase MeaB [Planctomycetia bacterium]|nr:methylmalonyl Co-A mutase-associated GTPase MeaB [Planctomycetia bacterium]